MLPLPAGSPFPNKHHGFQNLRPMFLPLDLLFTLKVSSLEMPETASPLHLLKILNYYYKNLKIIKLSTIIIEIQYFTLTFLKFFTCYYYIFMKHYILQNLISKM